MGEESEVRRGGNLSKRNGKESNLGKHRLLKKIKDGLLGHRMESEEDVGIKL